MSAKNDRHSSAHQASSTLRPRAKRLISGLDDDEVAVDLAHINGTHRASTAALLLDSRPTSPLPTPHPQRSLGTTASLARGPGHRSASGLAHTGPPTLTGLWGNSWNALQEIASDLLGSDLTATKTAGVEQRYSGKIRAPRSSSSGPSLEWGPAGSAVTASPARSWDVGVGTREEQAAAARARKRRDLLTGADASGADISGNFKRRLSDEIGSVSAPPGDGEDRDALVYIHHVTKTDTLAGITIKYNITANALRKANRMWPHDLVQARKTLILPVDACGVKGRPVGDAGDSVDLLTSESEALSTLKAVEVITPDPARIFSDDRSSLDGRNRASSTSTNTTVSAAASTTESAHAWQHDSWVLLPGHERPTQLARLSRRALGYFPPARRKSITNDVDTPRSSLDFHRTSYAGQHHHPSRSATSFVPQSPSLQPSHSHRLSAATNAYFPAYLAGPGGVGTMAKNVKRPGPAQDGLNKMFAKHLPDVAPPRNQISLYQPEIPMQDGDVSRISPLADNSAQSNASDAYSNAIGGSLNFNLENVGGAIEGWVRRLATKASSPLPDRQRAARASVGAPGKGAGEIGDLIEMTDDFEIGGDDNLDGAHDDTGTDRAGTRGRQPNIPGLQVLHSDTSASDSRRDGAVRGRRGYAAAGSGIKTGKDD